MWDPDQLGPNPTAFIPFDTTADRLIGTPVEAKEQGSTEHL